MHAKGKIQIEAMLLAVMLFSSGCTSNYEHNYVMSGQVVAVDGKEVVVCVSDTDAMKNHEVFNVYRTIYNNDKSEMTKGDSDYSREFVGKIRLGNKKDKHFAEAIVVSGDVIEYDMVEFENSRF